MAPQRHVILAIGGSFMFGPRIIQGVMAYSAEQRPAWELHFESDSIFAFGSGGRPHQRISYLKRVIDRSGTNGIIAFLRAQRLAEMMLELALPVVNVASCRSLNVPGISSVMADNRAVGAMVAEYFLRNGYRHFAFCGTDDVLLSRLRLEGFTEVVRRAGRTPQVHQEPSIFRFDADRVTGWLRSLNRPVGIMCSQDSVAMDVLTSCRRIGAHVPYDVAIVGAGNDPFMCTACTTPLSSVDVNVERVGYEAARVLDGKMRGMPTPATVLVPPATLAVRESSDTVAIDDPEVAAALRYIRQHASEPTGVKNVLSEVPISRRGLERRFRQKVGLTLRSEITRVHMDRAKQLLIDTDLSTTAVSGGSGFSRPEVFFAVFKRETGTTPLAFRRQFHMRHRRLAARAGPM